MADDEKKSVTHKYPHPCDEAARAIPREPPAEWERRKRGKKKNREARVEKRMAQIKGT